MNKYQVMFMRRALLDMDRIYSYIAKNLQESQKALRLMNKIEESILSLEQMPYRGAERKVGRYANRGYRQLMIEHYMVVYRIDEKNKQVLIVTVRYMPSNF